MCTAFNLRENGHFFGRNLDLDRSLGEQLILTPRNFPLHFQKTASLNSHYSFLGMGVRGPDAPLYYDAVNEQGLCMAGLNFPGNAFYHPPQPGRDNIAPYELIPWVLGQCASVKEAGTLLEGLNLTDIPLHPQVPNAPLHWIIGGEDGSLVAESRRDGLRLYEAETEVLTNNPPFPYHLAHLNNFRGLDVRTPENTLAPKRNLPVPYQGMGALGLPGDVTSPSRFVRAAFYLHHCQWDRDPVGQVFHVLDAVSMLRGSCQTGSGTWDETVYSACIDATAGRYYYTTYENRRIACVDLHREDLDSHTLSFFPLLTGQDPVLQNG